MAGISPQQRIPLLCRRDSIDGSSQDDKGPPACESSVVSSRFGHRYNDEGADYTPQHQRLRQTGRMSADQDNPGPPGNSPTIVLLGLAHRIESELATALEPLGLTVSRFGLLGHIAAVPGASFSDLARMSGITVQSAHRGVRTLADDGLVRDATARPGSASTLDITPAGRRLLARAMKATESVDDLLFGPSANPIQREIGEATRAAVRRSSFS
jgi:DNA-binding MarR family transcriptional regulator